MIRITHIKLINGHISQWIEYKLEIGKGELERVRQILQKEYNAIIDFRYESN
jgi:hypothetical protein